MRVLLTWTDRARGRLLAGDDGPLIRLLTNTTHRYESVRLLVPAPTPPAATAERNAGADGPPVLRMVADAPSSYSELVEKLRHHVDRVDVCEVGVSDPSDYALLFHALSAVVTSLPKLADIDVVLSAGTPQAQTIWVILVQAGLLDARMLQVIPPRFVPVPHPLPIREVRLDIDGFPEIRALREEVVRLRARAHLLTDMVGDSRPMRRLVGRIARVSQSDVPVLVLGETGVGKELVARAIHQTSPRAAAPHISENCGAFTEGALNSELFGHEVGAFTGATTQRRGLFEQADGGTLFLDEVAELAPTAQVRLLRVLQDGTLRRMGAERPIRVDVRVIAATHRDLPAMVAAGTFREDLYYRLRGAELHVPALRDRQGDLEQLVAAFLGDSPLKVTRGAWNALSAYHWPGNVRELQAEVRRWTVFCDAVVQVDDLSAEIVAGRAPHESSRVHSVADAVDTTPAIPTLAETEARAVIAALDATGGNISQAARALAIDRNTLKRKLRRYDRARLHADNAPNVKLPKTSV